MITSKLNLRPIIIMKGGEIGVGGFFRTRKKAKAKVIELLCKHFQESGLNINDYDITVGYCTNPEEASEYRKEFRNPRQIISFSSTLRYASKVQSLI